MALRRRALTSAALRKRFLGGEQTR